MKKNIGSQDRLIRAALAIFLLGLAWFYRSWIIAGCGVFVAFEAMAGWCIIYQLIGKNSCPIE